MNKNIIVKIDQRSFVINGERQNRLGKNLNNKDKADIIKRFNMDLPTHVNIEFIPMLTQKLKNTVIFCEDNNVHHVKFLSNFHKDVDKNYAKLFNNNNYIVPATYFDEGIEKNLPVFEEVYFYLVYNKLKGYFTAQFSYDLENEYLTFESERIDIKEIK